MNEPYGNLDRLNQIVKESEFDAVVAVSPENVPYTCGVFIWSQRGLRERLAMTVWPKNMMKEECGVTKAYLPLCPWVVHARSLSALW